MRSVLVFSPLLLLFFCTIDLCCVPLAPQKMPLLQNFRTKRYRPATSAAIWKFSQRISLAPGSHSLHIESLPCTEAAGLSVSTLPNLESLAFATMSDEFISGFLGAFPRLRELTVMRNTASILHPFLEPIYQGLARDTLRSLYVSTDIGPKANYQVMTILRTCPNLQHLGLNKIKGLTERCILAVPLECISRLGLLWIASFEWDFSNLLHYLLLHSAAVKNLSLVIGQCSPDHRLSSLLNELNSRIQCGWLDSTAASDSQWINRDYFSGMF